MAAGWRRAFCTSTDSSAAASDGVAGNSSGVWTPRSGALRRLLSHRSPELEPVLSPRFILAAIRSKISSSSKKTPPSSNHAPPVAESPAAVHSRRNASSAGAGKLKIYDDDEPLTFSSSGGAFIPIMESDEMDGYDEKPCRQQKDHSPPSSAGMEVALLPEVAVVASAKDNETLVAVLSLKASAAAIEEKIHAPLDLVLVLDAGAEIAPLRFTSRRLVSFLSSGDRLSVVLFSGGSRRVLPLKRMTAAGRRLSKHLLDSVAGEKFRSTGGACIDALKKAVRVLEERRQWNPVSAVLLMTSSESTKRMRVTSAGRFPLLEIPFGDSKSLISWLADLRTGVLLDVRVCIGCSTAQIPSVYSKGVGLGVFQPNSIRLGDILPHEERQLFVEMKVPNLYLGRHFLTVRCLYRHPDSQEPIYDTYHSIPVSSPGSELSVERIKNDFLTTRAVAESRRLEEVGDFTRACQMLFSAGVLLEQSKSQSAKEGLRVVREELATVERRWNNICDKEEQLLTPMTAWRVAERLARVAMMRKSANRVRDLHGLENARF